MVYCGKPSKGCGACRSRKVRCDQALPACSQCTKTNRECPGYRDQLSLMFRDESQDVVRKANTCKPSGGGGPSHRKSKGPKGGGPRNVSLSGNSSDCSQLSGSVTPQSLTLSSASSHDMPALPLVLRGSTSEAPLYIPLNHYASKDEAVCFFLRHNIWPGAFAMDSPLSLFAKVEGNPGQQAMKASVVAVGTAMLSGARKTPAWKMAAEREYGSALQLLNQAVSNQKDAKSNGTLTAVLLLAIFEIITSRTPRNIENWTNHVRGATALLQLRGVEQLQTPGGLKLFLSIRFQVIISCLQRGARVPDMLLKCSRVAMFLRPEYEAHTDHLLTIVAKLSNLRADVYNGVITDDAEILSTAYAIEAELITWLAPLPPLFQYETRDTSELDPARHCRGITPYGRYYHMYRDLWVCHAWNQYRCARIITGELILYHIQKVAAKSTAGPWSTDLIDLCNNIRMVARQMAADVCASIPYHFGAAEIPDPEAMFVPDKDSYVGGLVVLWPLFVAGASEPQGHPLRKWASECYKIVGHSMGIDQALALIEVMDTHKGSFDEIIREDDPHVQEAFGSGDLIEAVGQQAYAQG